MSDDGNTMTVKLNINDGEREYEHEQLMYTDVDLTNPNWVVVAGYENGVPVGRAWPREHVTFVVTRHLSALDESD